ncbi:uncharacterized protein LOC107486420 [Arachis duranensis]|uniref:Uncharacterized protein LOC107486420 n=1 Tax=Arachis duranensis TaxID=130453 RepID=A0A6P4DBP5_ARADU|nr:uncharacterized protein LOC107486420 [Arachis duranensis]
MESTHQPPSVILKLMGLDKVSPREPVRDKPKVLSEDYLQKVASIGVRKKRPSHQHCSLGTGTDEEMEEPEGISRVVKTIRRDKHHNPSREIGKENPYFLGTKAKCSPQQLLMDASNVNQGKLSQKDVHEHGEAGLYELLRLPKSQLDMKGDTFNSATSKANSRKEGNGVLFPSSCKNSRLANGMLQEVFYPKTMRVYPEMRETRKISRDDDFGKQSSRSFCKISENVSVQAGNATKRVLGTVPGNGTTNMNKQSRFGNVNIKTNLRCKVDGKHSRVRKVDLCGSSLIADNHRSITEDNLFEKYWGLRKSSKNSPPQKSRNQSINHNDYSETMDLRSSSEKSQSSSSFSDNNHIKENYAGLHNPTMQQCESTGLPGDNDALSHSSSASTQQDASELQEDSASSLLSGTDPDSLGSSEDSCEPSPISVLMNPSFGNKTSFNLKTSGTDVYDFSEVDDDEVFALNISSDEECGDKSVTGEYEEKKDLVGSFRSEESRDFSYLVEVLTEVGALNRSLFTDFSTWHSAECPISTSVFENLEKKFGEQKFWKRSERRLLFDRINAGLSKIMQPCSAYVPTWEKPVARRLSAELSDNMIEEEIWWMLVAQEKKAIKDSADNDMLGGEISWIELGENIEDIVREIVKLLIEDLAQEMVDSLENF